MKILLAHVNYPVHYIEMQNKSILFSLGLTKTNLLMTKSLSLKILAALTPSEHQVDTKEWFIKRDIDNCKSYDLIGLSCTTQYAKETYDIADEFRRRGKKVVIGGWHASALPKEAKQHADSIVIGEAEETWPQLLNDFESNKLKSFYIPTRPVDPKLIPVLKRHQREGTQGIQATRGCPNGCEFCSITNSKYGNIFRPRPIEHVLEEIESIDSDYILFYDNSLTINLNYTKQLFRELKNVNKKFFGDGNINILGTDDEFLKLAREAGFNGWFIGFESVSNESLKEMGKNKNKREEYKSAIKKLHDYGMHVNGSFVLGFDHDTKQTFNETFDVIQSYGIDIPNVNILTPLPGTPLYDRFDKENRILTKDWSKYTFRDVVFKPKKMTPEDLYNYTKELNDDLYSYFGIVQRVAKSLKLGLPLFFMIVKTNLHYRYGFSGKV